jgi:hypothetical protein
MQVIPEALPRVITQNDEKVLAVGEGVWGSLNTRGRVFPTESEAAIKDPARMWSHGETSNYGLDTRVGREHPDTSSSQVAMDGGMPFELDVPVAYTMTSGGIAGVQLGVVNEAISNNVTPIGTSRSEGTDQTGADARAAAVLMENIDADRIPCPRLCGATFGPGVGGLVTFHNGDVGKMWQWYQRTDSNRLSTIPGLIGEPSVPAVGISENPSQGGAQDGAPDQMAISRQCPRSLQDLIDMTSAAKEAQWGDRDNDSDGGSSAGVRALGINFFEDDSDSSSDLPDDDYDDLGDAMGPKNSKGLYDSYFGDTRRPTTETSENTDLSGRKTGDRKASNPVVGPSSDMLTPVVRVSHEFDRLAMNNQNVDLARAWTLGEWDYDVLEDVAAEEAGVMMVDLSERSRGPVEGLDEDSTDSSVSPSRKGKFLYTSIMSLSLSLSPTHFDYLSQGSHDIVPSWRLQKIRRRSKGQAPAQCWSRCQCKDG